MVEGFCNEEVALIVSEMEVDGQRAFLVQVKCGDTVIAFSSEEQLVDASIKHRQRALGALMEVTGRWLIANFSKPNLVIEA